MDEPRIHPNWTRKAPSPARDESILPVVLLSAVAIAGLFWFARTNSELDQALLAAEAQSKVIASSARLRQQESRENARVALRYISEAQAAREMAAANSSFQDKSIHRCVYGSSDTYQLGPCRAPWVEAPKWRASSREPTAAQQAYARRQAEARLRAEQKRFDELTRSIAWQPGYSPNSHEHARQNCAWTKQQRDQAYERMGNNRTFDFIRHWDELVYEACKNT